MMKMYFFLFCVPKGLLGVSNCYIIINISFKTVVILSAFSLSELFIILWFYPIHFSSFLVRDLFFYLVHNSFAPSIDSNEHYRYTETEYRKKKVSIFHRIYFSTFYPLGFMRDCDTIFYFLWFIGHVTNFIFCLFQNFIFIYKHNDTVLTVSWSDLYLQGHFFSIPIPSRNRLSIQVIVFSSSVEFVIDIIIIYPCTLNSLHWICWTSMKIMSWSVNLSMFKSMS